MITLGVTRRHYPPPLNCLLRIMRKHLLIAVALFFAVSQAQCAPPEKDERDVLQSAQVYHIMGANQASLEKLGAQLRSVSKDQLLNEFKRHAKAESSDTGSSRSGGNIGVITEGTMDEQFDIAVFSQEPMKVSPPIKSAFGWHLILVTSVVQEPIQDICQRSLTAIQRVIPITPKALYRFSIDRQLPENLHPAVLEHIGKGWGSPMNWNNNLAYMRAEPDSSKSGMARLVIHSEMPFARYISTPSACRRSARDTFQVDCSANTAALISHIEYEGRGAAGRRLIEVEVGPSKREFHSATSGFLAQVAESACKGSRQ